MADEHDFGTCPICQEAVEAFRKARKAALEAQDTDA